MNILQQQDALKNLSDQQLMQEAQAPSGSVPQFLVLGELKRRKDMRSSFRAQAEQPTTTVAEDLAAPPQGGLGAIAPGGLPQAVRGFGGGGNIMKAIQGQLDPVGFTYGGPSWDNLKNNMVDPLGILGISPDAPGALALSGRKSSEEEEAERKHQEEIRFGARDMNGNMMTALPGMAEGGEVSLNDYIYELIHGEPAPGRPKAQKSIGEYIGGGIHSLNEGVFRAAHGDTPIPQQGPKPGVRSEGIVTDVVEGGPEAAPDIRTSGFEDPALWGSIEPETEGLSSDFSVSIPDTAPGQSAFRQWQNAPKPKLPGVPEVTKPTARTREQALADVRMGREDFLTGIEDKLADRRAASEEGFKSDKWMALAEAGLAAAAGDSPHFLQNMSRGGLKGLGALRDTKREQRAADREFFGVEANLAQTRQGQSDRDRDAAGREFMADKDLAMRGEDLGLKAQMFPYQALQAEAAWRTASRPTEMDVLMGGDEEATKRLLQYRQAGSAYGSPIAGITTLLNYKNQRMAAIDSQIEKERDPAKMAIDEAGTKARLKQLENEKRRIEAEFAPLLNSMASAGGMGGIYSLPQTGGPVTPPPGATILRPYAQ